MLTRVKWTPEQIGDLGGRVALVTGGNSGIGLETARELAAHGARVVLGCRDESKGAIAAADIRRALPAAAVEVMTLDLADLDQVAEAAKRFAEDHTRLDLLCNNGGVMALPFRSSVDGFELQMATNHLGHFALTGGLLDLLLAAERPRVVTVSSGAHRMVPTVDLGNLDGSRGYDRWRAYGATKLANLLFTFELQRRADAAGLPVLAVAAHPGYAATNLQQAGARMAGERLRNAAMAMLNRVIGQDARTGAWPTLRAATDPDVRGGDYFGPGGIAELRGAPKRVGTSGAARDGDLAARLWAASEQATGVTFTALGG